MLSALVRYVGGSVTLALAAFVAGAPSVHGQAAEAGPTLSVRGGPVGTAVLVTLPDGVTSGVRIGFGGLSGGYELLGRAESGRGNLLVSSVTVPTWAERNLVYFFFVNVGGGTRIFSDPFIVTGPDGVVEVRGSVTQVADGCVLVTATDQTAFTLIGVTMPVTVGTRVTVDGNVASLDGIAPEGSACAARGPIPVRVRNLRVG